MKGIPAELHHETLNKTLQKMPTPSNLIFTNMFDAVQYESDRIRWILEYGTAGMTPFVAPGSPAPTMGDDGFYNEGSAAAAYWKEKVFVDEVRLNNLRDPLTPQQRQEARRQIARQQMRLKNRCSRRREWMLAKAFFDHGFTYQREGGTKFTVSYGVPTHHSVSLTGNDVWWDDTTDAPGSTATPIRDIFDAVSDYADDVGAPIEYSFMNTTVLKYLMFNADLQTLLQKSAFGEGDLFSNPAGVMSRLLGLGNLIVYDDLFEVSAWVTTSSSAGDSTVYIDDPTDFEAGEKVRLYKLNTPFTYEEATISSVSITNNSLTFTDTLTYAYSANKDRVIMRKKFIGDDKVSFFRSTLDGEKIAEFMEAPFGLNRTWGMFADSNEEWDPDGVWMRVQNKGLPVIYHPSVMYSLTVK
jgi:hypothetical protein